MLIPGQEEVSPCCLGLCLSVPCPKEEGSQVPLWGPSPPISPNRGSQGLGSCDCSLGLERKCLAGGWGGRPRRKGAGLLGRGGGVEVDFPLMEKEERAEGGGFLGKPRDESPRDRRVEGGKDMETSQAWGCGVREWQQWKTDNAAARRTPIPGRCSQRAPEKCYQASEGFRVEKIRCASSVPDGGRTRWNGPSVL